MTENARDDTKVIGSSLSRSGKNQNLLKEDFIISVLYDE